MAKTIFITGASRGLGKIWATAFLERGDKVVVTSRSLAGTKDLVDQYGSAVLPLALDVTNRAGCFDALATAKAHFGTIDAVINNAGSGVVGAVEELSEQDARNLFDINFFGTLWITQAALPILREQGHGHIIQLSSALGIYTFPTLGIYSASKFAVEGLSEALALETKELGIHVTIVQPNGFATSFSNHTINSQPNTAYDAVRAQLYANPHVVAPDAYGDPQATAPAMLQLIDSPTPPLHFILGKNALPLAQAAYASRLAEWETWKAVSSKAHGL